MEEVVAVGPWGSSDEKSWFYKGKGKIRSIEVHHGECIHGVSFIGRNDRYVPKIFGGVAGHRVEVEINIDVEELNCISGTIGYFDSKMVVTSLSFSTHLNKIGPFGKENGTHFSLPISKGSFFGFFGHSGEHLHSIGAFLVPT